MARVTGNDFYGFNAQPAYVYFPDSYNRNTFKNPEDSLSGVPYIGFGTATKNGPEFIYRKVSGKNQGFAQTGVKNMASFAIRCIKD